MTKHKPASERRDDILDAARNRFVTDGYERARLNDIAADAGLSKGGVYFHFRSKREIFDALIEREFAQMQLSVKKLHSHERDTESRITAFTMNLLEVIQRDPDIAKFRVVLQEMAVRHEDVGQQMRALQELLVSDLRNAFVSAREDGIVRSDIDEDAAARMLATLLDGVWVAVANGYHSGRIPADLFRAAAQQLRLGIGAIAR